VRRVWCAGSEGIHSCCCLSSSPGMFEPWLLLRFKLCRTCWRTRSCSSQPAFAQQQQLNALAAPLPSPQASAGSAWEVCMPTWQLLSTPDLWPSPRCSRLGLQRVPTALAHCTMPLPGLGCVVGGLVKGWVARMRWVGVLACKRGACWSSYCPGGGCSKPAGSLPHTCQA
jgi:hypothetical protein